MIYQYLDSLYDKIIKPCSYNLSITFLLEISIKTSAPKKTLICKSPRKTIYGVQNLLTREHATECIESIANMTLGNSDLCRFVRTYFDPRLEKTELHRLVLAGTVLRSQATVISNPAEVCAPKRIRDAFVTFHGDIQRNKKGMNHANKMNISMRFTLRDIEMNGENICNDNKFSSKLSTVEGRMSYDDVARLYSGNEKVKLPINGRSSVLLHVDVPNDILTSVIDEIDPNLFPRSNDTPETLTDRISHSSYLDEMSSFASAPSTSKLIRQNSQVKWNQPKRRSTSLVIRPKHIYRGRDGEGQGEEVMTLFNYTSYGRYPDDWRGRPMTSNVAVLNIYIWIQCWSYLTYQSRRSPPTHVQILFYYGALGVKRRSSPAHGTGTYGSGMNQHRDNFSCRDLLRIIKGYSLGEEGHPSAGADNSQIVGTNVLVYTIGDKPQVFTLRYPNRSDFLEKRQNYTVVPSFQFECGHGTVSVLDPVDDLFMTHEVCFHFKPGESKNKYRFGYCFRWLQSEKDFYVKSCGMRLDEQALSVVSKKRNFTRASDEFPEFVRTIYT